MRDLTLDVMTLVSLKDMAKMLMKSISNPLEGIHQIKSIEKKHEEVLHKGNTNSKNLSARSADLNILQEKRNTIERCTNTKVFCIMTTANATKIHVFQDKCAILWLVKSPNSQVKFKCDASSVRFPAKFVAFCMFLAHKERESKRDDFDELLHFFDDFGNWSGLLPPSEEFNQQVDSTFKAARQSSSTKLRGKSSVSETSSCFPKSWTRSW